MPSYTLWVTPLKFCKMKVLTKMYICGKFHQHSICACKGKNQNSWNGPFLGGFGPLLPLILFNLAEIFTRGSLPIRQSQCLKNPSKFRILVQIERSQDPEKSLNSCKIKQKKKKKKKIKNFLGPITSWGHVKGLSEILTWPIIGPSIHTYWMPSFRFWVFVVFDST